MRASVSIVALACTAQLSTYRKYCPPHLQTLVDSQMHYTYLTFDVMWQQFYIIFRCILFLQNLCHSNSQNYAHDVREDDQASIITTYALHLSTFLIFALSSPWSINTGKSRKLCTIRLSRHYYIQLEFSFEINTLCTTRAPNVQMT